MTLREIRREMLVEMYMGLFKGKSPYFDCDAWVEERLKEYDRLVGDTPEAAYDRAMQGL